MASTGAVLYVKPRAFVTVSANHKTSAVLYLSARFLSGIYTATGVTASANLRGRKSWMPHRGERWVDEQGRPTDEFFRFVDYLANTMIGGPSGATLPDVVETVTTTQAQASTVAEVVAGVSQQVVQNAEAGAVLREAAVTAGVATAAALPPFQITSQMER
jgi:hypothetical protein